MLNAVFSSACLASAGELGGAAVEMDGTEAGLVFSTRPLHLFVKLICQGEAAVVGCHLAAEGRGLFQFNQWLVDAACLP